MTSSEEELEITMLDQIQTFLNNHPTSFLLPTVIFGNATQARSMGDMEEVKEHEGNIVHPFTVLEGRKSFGIPTITSRRIRGSEVPTPRRLFHPSPEMGYEMYKGTNFTHQHQRPAGGDPAMLLVSGPRTFHQLHPNRTRAGVLNMYVHWTRKDGTRKRRPMATVGDNKVFIAKSGQAIVYTEAYWDHSERTPEGYFTPQVMIIDFEVLTRRDDKPDVVRYKCSELGVAHSLRHMAPREGLLKNARRNEQRNNKIPHLFRRVKTAQDGYIHCGLQPLR